MPSLRSRLLYHFVKYQLAKLGRRKLPLPEYRLAREAAAQRMFRMPLGVQVEAAQVDVCGGEWLRPALQQGKGVVLYLHGGAYTGGSCITHRAAAARLAQAARRSVFNLGKRGSNHFDPHDDVARIFLVRATPDFAISFAIAAEFSISTPLSRQLLAPFAPTCPLWA